MAVKSFSLELDSIVLVKFGSLVSGITSPDKKNSLDILPQVIEVNIYESIFSTIMRADLIVSDQIGLFVNFPLSGEEAVFIKYKTVNDPVPSFKTLAFVIDSVTDVQNSNDARGVHYQIHLVAIESFANALKKVQKSYEGNVPQIVTKVIEDHIDTEMRKFYPDYVGQNMINENNDSQSSIFVIPNMHPFAAVSMLADMCVSENSGNDTYLFWQTSRGFHFQTLQSLFKGDNSRRAALKDSNTYKYTSNEIEEIGSKMKNEGRLVTNLITNKRLSTLQKVSQGYFHNVLMEINIPQKAYWCEPARSENYEGIYSNQLNTTTYTGIIPREGDDEVSNRTKYRVVTERENDHNVGQEGVTQGYSVQRTRHRWGRDLIATIAMGQIDYTVTIPGTDRFHAGDLINIEIPEMHAFNSLKEDDFVSGLFLISELKHLFTVGGFHTTVLRINKDSYKSSIDRESRFV